MSEYKTVADVFNDSNDNVMTFDEAITNIRAGKDVNPIIYYVYKLSHPAYKAEFFEGDWQMLYDTNVSFANFCIYLDTITSKYDITLMNYALLTDNVTVVFWMRLAKKGA